MLDFQQKRKLRAFIYNKITLGVFSFVVLILLFSTFNVWNKKVESQRLTKSSLAKVLEMEKRNDFIDSQIERLNTQEGIEEEIRSKFSVAKEGEKVVVVVNDNLDDSIPIQEEKTLFEKFIDLFR